MAALGVDPASRVAMNTSSLLIAFGPPLTFKAPAPKLIISDEFKSWSFHVVVVQGRKRKVQKRDPRAELLFC